jgi:ribonucleoside-diphosphate reductase alpha chain
VTIYRDQSRQEQVLHLSSADTPDPETSAPADAAPPAPSGPAILPVPGTISGTTYRKETPAGTARVVVNTENGEPFEVFLLLGRAGSEVQSFMEALGRIISLHLRTQDHVPAKERLHHIADQLRGIGGANQMGFGPHRVLSVVDAIGQVLQQAESPTDSVVVETASDAHPVAPSTSVPSHPTYDLCPQCNAPTLVYEEGCLHCINPDGCGWSRC